MTHAKTANMPSFPVAPRCPRCAAPLAMTADHDLGEGESGGVASVRRYACEACDTAVVQQRIDKIGQADEQWRLERDPGGPAACSRGEGSSRPRAPDDAAL